jgi:hypothetical protein
MGQSADGCEKKRVEQQGMFLAMLKQKDTEFAVLKDEVNLKRYAYRQCMWTSQKPIDEKYGAPCQKGYVNGAHFMVEADKITGDVCGVLNDASQRAASCDKGEAACLKLTADDLVKAKAKIGEASALAKKAGEELHKLSYMTKLAAGVYQHRLSWIASQLRLYAQVKPLDINDPELNKALHTEENEGVPLHMLMGLMQIRKLEPAQFEARASELQKKIDDSQDAHAAQDSGSSPIAQQLNSGINSSQLAQYSADSQNRISALTGKIDSQITGLNSISTGLGPVPEKTVSGVAPKSFALTSAGTIGNVNSSPSISASISPTAGPNSNAPTNGSSASRAPTPGTNSGVAANAANLDALQSASSVFRRTLSSTPASASAARAVARQNIETSLGTAAVPSNNPDSPILEIPALKNSGPIQVAQAAVFSVASPGDPHGHLKNSVTVNESYTQAPAAPARPSIAGGSAISLSGSAPTDAYLSISDSHKSAWSIAPQAIQDKAASFADRELSRFERSSGPLSPSMRDRLRMRMQNDFASRAAKFEESTRPAASDGSNRVVSDLLRTEKIEQSWVDRPGSSEFQMLAADTDREVTRLIGGMGNSHGSTDGSTIDGINLFKRVHEAYARQKL